MAAAKWDLLMEAFGRLQEELPWSGLFIAPEKVQEEERVNYLGLQIGLRMVQPLALEIRIDRLKNLNDFQK